VRWLTLMVLVSCAPGAVGPRYRGEPLFTVTGQLLSVGAAPTGPLRLALAWYPDSQSPSAPRAVITQDIAYEGRFPLAYSFSVFSVPPEGVLVEYPGRSGVTRAAYGVLMAYEDVNGNGQLDLIPTGGGAIDRVLGTSIGDTYNGRPASRPLYLVYVEGTPGPEWVDTAPGYNLWGVGRAVPSSTSVPIALDATNELNFFICEEFISGAGYGFDLPCNLAPTGGVRVVGNVHRHEGLGGLTLRVTDGARPLPGVQFAFNDAGIAATQDDGVYWATGLPVPNRGMNTLTVQAPNQPALIFALEASGPFELQAPTTDLRLLAGSTLTTQWTASAGASFYQVQATALTPPNPGPPPILVTSRGEASYSTRLSGFVEDDLWQLTVSAFAPRYLAHGRGGSLVNLSTSRSVFVDVRPADVGLWLEGAVSRASYQGQDGASVFVQGFDGVTLRTDLVVTAEGEAIPWVAGAKAYAGSIGVQPGETSTLGVSSQTQPRKTFAVSLPDDFVLTAPPLSHPSKTPLVLTWSPSPGASEYRVFVQDAAGRQLHFEVTTSTSATVPALDAVGVVTVSVSAVKRSGSRHLVGIVQKSVDVALTP
jgi:hypothetical protein